MTPSRRGIKKGTRKFGKHKLYYQTSKSSKKEAKEYAKKLKSGWGYKRVRIVKVHYKDTNQTFYDIYASKS